MTKVYCGKCKFLENQYTIATFWCIHPSIRKEVIIRDWFSETTSESKGDPKKMNANNDCQYYEEA